MLPGFCWVALFYEVSMFPGISLSGVSVLPKLPLIQHSDLFDEDGTLQPMLQSFWAQWNREQRATFGHHHGLYAFPTVEGIQLIRELIGDRAAIEIGAGNGAFCKALGIPGTDNYQQAMPKYKAYYRKMNQPIVKYGSHVERLEASVAIAKYKPQVVIASWVTHLYMPQRHHLGGNEIGVDEHYLLSEVEDYIFIGDTHVHAKKPLLQDYEAGKITTHKIHNVYLGNDLFPSRGMRGDSFMLHFKRK